MWIDLYGNSENDAFGATTSGTTTITSGCSLGWWLSTWVLSSNPKYSAY